MTTQTQQPSSVSYTNDDESWKTYEEAVEYYYNNYPEEHYFTYPEFTVQKLGLDQNVLNSLNNNPEFRNRENIRDWMKSLNITLDELYFVGW